MISYNLHCEKDHEFEGWFSSSSDYDDQRERGLLSCPSCGSANITKSLMAPAVSTSRKKQDRMDMANTPQMPKELIEKIRAFKKEVVANSEDVGERFPEEARKIHYGEAEARGIVGHASLEEAVKLNEEGVGVMPLPDLPEDKN